MRSLAELAISETGFVFDPRTGATFNVNPTGLVVLFGLRDGRRPEAIAALLRERFEGTPEDVDEHLGEFTQLLRRLELLSDASASGEST